LVGTDEDAEDAVAEEDGGYEVGPVTSRILRSSLSSPSRRGIWVLLARLDVKILESVLLLWEQWGVDKEYVSRDRYDQERQFYCEKLTITEHSEPKPFLRRQFRVWAMLLLRFLQIALRPVVNKRYEERSTAKSYCYSQEREAGYSF
jgi:hypothetical protein